MKRLNLIFSAAFLLFALTAVAQPGDLPANQEPGKCYAKCLIADEYETVTEQVLVRAASKRVETIPAEYETASEQVLIKAASTRIERVPAIYETVTREYVVGCPDGYHVDPSCASAGSGANAGTGGADCDCIKEIPVPAVYETVTEQVMTKAASSRIETVPATYKTVTEEVMVKPVTYRTTTIPAEYEKVTEQVLVKEASTRIERVKAEYVTETETIETKPATTKWIKKKADRNCLSADPEDCLVWCLVEVPAQYRTVTKQVRKGCPSGYTDNGDDCTKVVEVPAEYTTRTISNLKSAATTKQIEIPAEYKTITKKVIDVPASTRTIEVPAEYSTRTYRVVKTPASTKVDRKPMLKKTYTEKQRAGCPDGYVADTGANSGNTTGSTGTGDCIRVIDVPAEYGTRSFRTVKAPAATREIEIPAEYATVTKRKLVKKGGFTEWREVLCGDEVTSEKIRSIQRALRERGYNPGPIDNILGTQTKAALKEFQKDNGLPIGQLDKETLKQLGVNY